MPKYLELWFFIWEKIDNKKLDLLNKAGIDFSNVLSASDKSAKSTGLA